MDFFKALEDRYYGFLDWLDSKGVPVYSAVDRIDRVVPSFALLAAVFLLVLFYFFFSPVVFQPEKARATLIFEDSHGNPLIKMPFVYRVAGKEFQAKTNENGVAEIELPRKSRLEIDIDSFRIGENDFEGIKKVIEVSGDISEKIVLVAKAKAELEKIVFFQNTDNSTITGEELRVSLSCSNPNATSPGTVSDTDKDGKIVFISPKNCGTLSGRLVEPEKFAQKSFIISQAAQAVVLEKISSRLLSDEEKGSIRVRLLDAEGRIIDTTEFRAALLDVDGAVLEEKTTAFYGEAIFSGLAPASYGISVSHEKSDYGIQSRQEIFVTGAVENLVEITMAKSVKGILKAAVIDKETGQNIPNATVELRDSEGTKVAEKNTGETGTLAEFALTETKNYLLFVSHPDYLFETVEAGSTAREITVEMEKLNENNSGKIQVKVLDEEGKPVENATAKIRFFETGFIVPVASKPTNAQGIAFFVGIKPGKYYAYAEKFPVSGNNKQEAKQIDARAISFFTVKLKIGNAKLKMKVTDSDNQPLNGAEAEIFDSTGESIGIVPMPNGIAEYSLKADKSVFVRFSYPGLQSFQTLPQQLLPDKDIVFDGKLLPRLVSGNPQIEFLGFFDSLATGLSREIQAGKTYVAKFRLSIPERLAARETGIHVRAGNAESFAASAMEIGEVIAGNISAEHRGATYSPETGEQVDFANLTDSEAKWVNIKWNALEQGDYIVAVKVKVRQSTKPQSLLELNYRAWVLDDQGNYLRDPIDTVLGNREFVQEKHGLYAKTFSKVLFESDAQSCGKEFCYSGEWLLDKQENIYVGTPYRIKVAGEYALNFAITNNTLNSFGNSSLAITALSDNIEFSSFAITTPDSQVMLQENTALQEIGPVSMGYFGKGKTVFSLLGLKTKKQGRGSIRVEIIADNRQVISKTIDITISPAKELSISVFPEQIMAFTETKAVVTVLQEGEKKEKTPSSNALATMAIVFPDKTEIRSTRETGPSGETEFNIPPSSPGTRIVFTAEKTGFIEGKAEIRIDGNIAALSPKVSTSELNTLSKKQDTIKIGIKNITGKQLSVSDARIVGDFRGLLDTAGMNTILRQYSGTTIGVQESTTIEAKIILSKNARKTMFRNEKLSGKIIIGIETLPERQRFEQLMPLEVSIILGDLPDNSPCLVLSKKSWETVTKNNRAELGFEIKNNCLSNTTPIPLENISARVIWKSEEAGFVELSLRDSNNSIYTEALKQEGYTKVMENIPEDSSIQGTLYFTPKPGFLGKQAIFSVLIDGEITTSEGKAFVGSQPLSVEAKIFVINLQQCIIAQPERINLQSANQQVQLSSAACGPTNVIVEICPKDPGCSNGTKEGKIFLSQQSFTLLPNNPAKTISVGKKEIPGMYGIEIFARIPETDFEEIKTVDVFVPPETENVFTLDKYEFFVIGKGAKDTATLTNTWLKEIINVTATLCAWAAAEESHNGVEGTIKGASRAGVGLSTIGAGTPGGFQSRKNTQMMYAGVNGLAAFSSALVGGATFASAAAAGAIGLLIGFLLFLIICLMKETHPLPDFVINLAEDAGTIGLDTNGVIAYWNLEEAKVFGDVERQTVGVIFENIGAKSPKPVYGLATFNATKHSHKNPTDYGSDSDFWSYDIKDSKKENFSRKFHLKFTVSEPQPKIPQIAKAGTFEPQKKECKQGALTGATGKENLPKIKLDWSWNDETGIAHDSCNQENPEYVYCDATQFSIEISRRLHMFDEFLKANNYHFECPEHPIKQAIQQDINRNSNRAVASNYIGLQGFSLTFDAQTANFSVTVTNNTQQQQQADVNVEILPSKSVSVSQTKCSQSIPVPAGQQKSAQCAFPNLPKSTGQYVFKITMSSPTTQAAETDYFFGNFIIGETPEKTPKGCWVSNSTSLIEGIPAIEYPINADPGSVNWTSDIPDAPALRSLLLFNAFLLKDSYTQDFKKDFAEFYIDKSLYNAPAWFADDPEGKIASFFLQNKISFTQKFATTEKIPATGLYEVFLEITGTENGWEMFDSNSNPLADVKIQLNLAETTALDSVFYSMPLNGNIGLESSNGRQGYGTRYENISNPIIITSRESDSIRTIPSPNSSSEQLVITETLRDFKKLNSSPSNRGFLLKIQHTKENIKKMVFSPTYATPVVMKMASAISPEPFSAFYTIRQGEQAVLSGETSAFWTGMNACIDFTGIPAITKFHDTPDRRAESTDPIENWRLAYALDWEQAIATGNVYLKTIMYTPVDSALTMNAVHPKELSFRNADSAFGTTANLSGVSGMKNNNGVFKIDELQQLFEMVGDESVCISNTGTETTFFWNTEKLLESGSQPVKGFENSLKPGNTCIGG